MSAPAITIAATASVAAAAARMRESRVKRLPVIDENGSLVGIVSRMNVLSIFARTDQDIRTELAKILGMDFALDPAAFDVSVRSGIVTITGQAESRIVARQLEGALRNVEGVVDVHSKISYPAAATGTGCG